MDKEAQNEFYRSLGESIKAIRKVKMITQEALSNHLGLSRISIVNIERGKQKILLHTLVELSVFLGVSLNELLGNKIVNDLENVINDKANRRARSSESVDIIKEFSKLYSQKE